MTHPIPSPASAKGVTALENQLEYCQDMVRRSLDLAQSIDRARDDYGQDLAFERALKFMKASAKVGMALAKLNGSHSSNIRIHRTQTTEQDVRVEFPAPERRAPAPGSKPLDPATEARVNQIYDDWLQARVASHGDVKHFREDGEDEEDREEQGDAKRVQQGGPPSKNLGSNTQE